MGRRRDGHGRVAACLVAGRDRAASAGDDDPSRGPASGAVDGRVGRRRHRPRQLHPLHRGRRRLGGAGAGRAGPAGSRAARRRRSRGPGTRAQRRPAGATGGAGPTGRSGLGRTRARGRSAPPGVRLAPARRRAVRGSRGPALHAVRPGREVDPARCRPPLHRAGLPGGAARRRRDPSRRLCAGAVVAIEPWIRGLGRVGGERHPVRSERRAGVRIDPLECRTAPDAVPVRPHAGLAAARVLSSDRFPGAAAGVGLRVLEEPRRVRPPGRRRRRLRGAAPP